MLNHFDGEHMNSERLQLVMLKKFMLSGILFAVASTGLLAQTNTIHIRVLDGRTGKNLSGMPLDFVDYHTGSDGSTHDDLNGRIIVKTSVDGDSYSANPDAHGVLVFDVLDRDGIWIPCTRQKLFDSKTKTYGNEYLYPVATIITSGFVAKNSCSKRTATAKPGELVIFVRPVTWWEIFKAVFTS